MHVLLIDGLNLIRRIYAAVPTHAGSGADDAAHFAAAETAIGSSVKRALSREQPSHAVCVLESHGKTWRHMRYPAYKQNRAPMPAKLAAGMHRIESAINAAGVRCLTVPGYEADDVIATMARGVSARATAGDRVTILSTDTKFCQLLRSGIVIFDHFKQRRLDAPFCQSRFGVNPPVLNDWFALVGDSALNISGVSGVGQKTATRLLNEYSSLERMYQHLDELSPRLANNLRQQKPAAQLAKELIGLRENVDIGVNLRDYRVAESTP